MCMRCIEQNRLNWSQEPLKGQFRVKQFNHISANKTLHKLRENPEFIYPLSLALMKLWDWEVKDLLSIYESDANSDKFIKPREAKAFRPSLCEEQTTCVIGIQSWKKWNQRVEPKVGKNINNITVETRCNKVPRDLGVRNVSVLFYIFCHSRVEFFSYSKFSLLIWGLLMY